MNFKLIKNEWYQIFYIVKTIVTATVQKLNKCINSIISFNTLYFKLPLEFYSVL